MPLQGSLDNRYEVRRSLGRGGMAEVYLARDRVLDRDVALKVLSRCYAEDEGFVRRFRREAQSAASLAHPNVVSIHDLGEVEGEAGEPPTYYIAMEYVEGISLRELLEREVRLPYETAVHIARQVAQGLAAAHERGIVHRDIKPHNILLSGDVGGEYPGEGRGGVKVADFGIARAASSTTNTEGILGTAYYLPPEQAMGGEATFQSDLYSLGVVLYEMLTGRRPYDAESPFGVAMRHVTGDLRPPKQVLPDLPAKLNSIVVRLLGKDPEERHRDAEELLADLEDLPLEPETPEPGTPEVSSGKRRPRGVGLLVPLCALVLLTASLWSVQQGFGLSSLRGFDPGELRDDVENILGREDGNEAPQSDAPQSDGARSGGAQQPGPAADPPDGSPSGESSSGEEENQESASAETQEDGATGRSDESSSDEDGAAGEDSSQDTPSGNDPSGSSGDGSSGADDNASDGGSSGGDSTGGGSADSASEDGTGGSSGGDNGGANGSASGGDASGGGDSGSGASGGGDSGDEEQSVYVPDLTGQTAQTARETLSSTGFEVAGVVEQPGSGAEGTVLYTDPAAGSALEPGAGVTLIVSSGAESDPSSSGGGGGSDNGPSENEGSDNGSDGSADEGDEVSVPDVTGRQSQQAVMILESAGLNAEVRGAFGGADSGTVVATDPEAGSTVEEGATVTLTVTDGPQSAMAPEDEEPPSEQYQYED